MTQTELLATKRLALLAKRDLIIKQNQELHTALTTHSDSLNALCQEMTTLLLEAEAKIASQAETILTAQNTIRSQQADLKRCQAELASIRREMATYRTQTPSPVEEDTILRRGKSLQRAMQKQRKDQFVHQHTLETQIEKLTAQLTAKDEQIRTLQAKWQDTHLQNLKLMEECHVQRTELYRLRPTPTAPPLPEEESPVEEPISEDPFIDKLNHHARTLTISVIGGSPTWQKKAQTAFPQIRFLGNQDFDAARLDTTDILLVNTNHVSHSCTTKAVDLANARHIEICYTSKHNLSQIAELLCDRIHTVLS